MGFHPFLLVGLISSNTIDGLTPWIGFQTHSCQWFWSVQTLERDLQPAWAFSVHPFLVSDSYLLKHWRGTHKLDKCSPFLSVALIKSWRGTHSLDRCSSILVNCSDLLKHWRTHLLDRYSCILISGSDLLKHWWVTHNLDSCSSILISCSPAQTLDGN